MRLSDKLVSNGVNFIHKSSMNQKKFFIILIGICIFVPLLIWLLIDGQWFLSGRHGHKLGFILLVLSILISLIYMFTSKTLFIGKRGIDVLTDIQGLQGTDVSYYRIKSKSFLITWNNILSVVIKEIPIKDLTSLNKCNYDIVVKTTIKEYTLHTKNWRVEPDQNQKLENLGLSVPLNLYSDEFIVSVIEKLIILHVPDEIIIQKKVK